MSNIEPWHLSLHADVMAEMVVVAGMQAANDAAKQVLQPLKYGEKDFNSSAQHISKIAYQLRS